jgi:acetyl esterase/lipase
MSGADADPTALIAEQQSVNQGLLRDWQRMPAPGTVSVARMRHAKRFNTDGSQKMARVERAIDRTLASSRGQFAVREFPIENCAGLYLHFHGGGWALGSIYEQDELLDALAQATRMTVVSIDYPLAPEQPLPVSIAQA